MSLWSSVFMPEARWLKHILTVNCAKDVMAENLRCSNALNCNVRQALQNAYLSDSLLCQSRINEYLSQEIYCGEILEPLTKCSFPL